MLLETENLEFGFAGFKVGEDVNLSIRAGEVVCLLGPNGSGKTTLFRTLLGLLDPLGGKIFVNSKSINQLKRRELASRVAYVPQAHSATFPFRVRDIVLMGRTSHRGIFSAPNSVDASISMSALSTLGIEDLAEREYTRISGGQRQLVLVARALAQSSPLIIMDEPTASLDYGNQVRVLAEVRNLARRGLGVMLSTHSPDHAFAVASRVLLLNDGRIEHEGSPETVLNPEQLRRVYQVEVAVEKLSSGQTVCVPKYDTASSGPDPE